MDILHGVRETAHPGVKVDEEGAHGVVPREFQKGLPETLRVLHRPWVPSRVIHLVDPLGDVVVLPFLCMFVYAVMMKVMWWRPLSFPS